MASLTIRNIDESLKAKLRMCAASHGHSMEEEARQILKQALLHASPSFGLGSRITQRFAAVGGVDLSESTRLSPRNPPKFGPENTE